MSEESKVEQQQMSEDDIRASWVSSSCAACSGAKSKASAFCKSCTLALPILVRNWLSEGPTAERFFVTFRAWFAHLKLWEDKIKRVGWDFKSLREIEDAGYKLLNVSRCRANGCKQEIGWLEDTRGGRLPINLSDLQPHRTSCRNPNYFLQTPAQRRRRR